MHRSLELTLPSVSAHFICFNCFLGNPRFIYLFMDDSWYLFLVLGCLNMPWMGISCDIWNWTEGFGHFVLGRWLSFWRKFDLESESWTIFWKGLLSSLLIIAVIIWMSPLSSFFSLLKSATETIDYYASWLSILLTELVRIWLRNEGWAFSGAIARNT